MSPEQDFGPATQEEIMGALFAQMVIQQANMALMLLGKMAHPQTGETLRDLEGARIFIDQLEMLEVKTKGNLSKEESDLLRQSLMTVRLAFVESIKADEPAPEPKPAPGLGAAGESPSKTEPKPEAEKPGSPESATDADSKKRFSKKY